MKSESIYKRHQRELRDAVTRSYRKYGSVRVAANQLGIPRSTFHDILRGRSR